MAFSIADAIFSQMRQAGQPRTTTTTGTADTTQTSNEPIDMGQLGLLLYFLLNKNKTTITPMPGISPIVPPARDVSGLPSTAPASMSDQSYSQLNPIQILLSLFGSRGTSG